MATSIASRHLAAKLACRQSRQLRCIHQSLPQALAAPCSRRGVKVRAAATEAPPRDAVITSDPDNNVTDNIYSKIGVNLHLRPKHPLDIIRSTIYQYFDDNHEKEFKKFDDLYPVVSTHANFDSVLVPSDHISRQPNDTYYVSKDTVLRCVATDYDLLRVTLRPAMPLHPSAGALQHRLHAAERPRSKCNSQCSLSQHCCADVTRQRIRQRSCKRVRNAS